MQEIERKFLVVELPDLMDASSQAVRQGYLTALSDSTELRLRQKGDRYYLTQKGGSGLVREEREAEIDATLFEVFWPATDGRRVEKTRWIGSVGAGLSYELDIFEGALSGLIMVEVEFANAHTATQFVPPSWFGREVTEDKRFGNKVLAENGIPLD